MTCERGYPEGRPCCKCDGCRKMQTCEHSRGPDPRFHDRCVKCGLLIGKPTTTFDTDFLDQAAELCEKAHNLEPTYFTRHAMERLHQGEQRYANEYLAEDRDNILEALEEGPDVGTYSLLELARRQSEMREDDWLELRMRLLAATTYAAACHEELRRAQRFRDEILADSRVVV